MVVKLDSDQIAKVDKLVQKYNKEYGEGHTRDMIIDSALQALEEITDSW